MMMMRLERKSPGDEYHYFLMNRVAFDQFCFEVNFCNSLTI